MQVTQIWNFVKNLGADIELAAGDVAKVTALIDSFNADVQAVLGKSAPAAPVAPAPTTPNA